MAKDELILKEVTRLTSVFKDIDKGKMKLCSKLIQNAAFMSVTLEELQGIINSKGVTEKYQNGENQSGVKKSSEVDIYNNFIKQYTVIIRQLNDLLPEKQPIEKDDEFEKFANDRDD